MNKETNISKVLVPDKDEFIQTEVKVIGVCGPVRKCQIRESEEVIHAFDAWLDRYKDSVTEEKFNLFVRNV